jgi:hypothetical protein
VDIKIDFGYKKVSGCKLELRESEINMTKVYSELSLIAVTFFSFLFDILNILKEGFMHESKIYSKHMFANI